LKPIAKKTSTGLLGHPFWGPNFLAEFSCPSKVKVLYGRSIIFCQGKNQTKKSGTRKKSVLNYLANKIGALLKNDNSPSDPDGARKSPSNSGWLRGKFAEPSGSIQEKSPSIC